MSARMILVLWVSLLLGACGSPEQRAAGYTEEAESLYEEGDLDQATLQAKNALQIAPKNPRSRLVLAKIAMDKQEFQTALNHLVIAEESDPDRLETHLMLGFIYFTGQASELLAKQVDHANRIEPNDSGTILLNARLLAVNGDRAGALAKVQESIDMDPSDPHTNVFMAALIADLEGPEAAIAAIDASVEATERTRTQGLREFRMRLLADAGRMDEVEAELRSLVDDFPDNERYSNLLARYYVDTGQIDEAVQTLRAIAELNRDDLNRQVALVQFLAGQRGAEAAEIALKEYIAESPDSPELRLALGQLFESDERLSDAVKEYERAIELGPTSDASYIARNRIVSIRVRQNRPDDAQELIAEILTARSADEDALLARGAFNFISARYDEVVADARLVVRKDPTSETALLLLGRAYGAQGKGVLAEDAYRRVLAINPANPDAASELSALLARDGRIKAALEILEAALQFSDDASLLESQVNALLAAGELESAEIAASRIAELEPDSGRADFQIGRIAEARGDSGGALAAYRRSLQKSPDSVNALKALVELELASERGDEAIADLQRFIDANPDQLAARLLLGNAYLRLGDKAAAERELEWLADARPGAPETYLNLAAIYEINTDERYQALRRGLEANPTDPRFGALLGSEYQTSGRIDEAIAAYEEALQLNPDNDLVANNLAMLLLQHRTDEASLSRALEISRRFSDSKQAVPSDTLGWAYYRTGQYPAAVQTLKAAVAIADNIPEIRYHLGMALQAEGNPAQARQELSSAIEMADETSPWVGDARAMLAELGAE